jgi:hypothetical protein
VRVQCNRLYKTRRLIVVAKLVQEHGLAAQNLICGYVTFIATTWYLVQAGLFARQGLLLQQQLILRDGTRRQQQFVKQ